MKKQILTLSVLLSLSIGHCMAQATTGTPVPGVAFTYDPGGRRILREPGIVCLGCKQTPKDSLVEGTPVKNITNTEKITIVAYPNPTSKDVYISNESWKQGDKAVIQVFDVLGKNILRKDCSQAKEIIPFERCAAGTYMVYYYLNELPAQLWKIVKL